MIYPHTDEGFEQAGLEMQLRRRGSGGVWQINTVVIAGEARYRPERLIPTDHDEDAMKARRTQYHA